MFSYSFYQSFSESRLMCSPLSGVLPIDKGMVFFTILRSAVGYRNFDILSPQVNDGVKQIIGVCLILQQISQSIFRIEFYSIEVYGEPRVEVNVIFEHAFYIL
ncbi:MAG: Uncharacterised protein [Flavobacteriaceae bacterium]|nr:MAG: Uncharacterised protein [Flavobacteriaceae bacterium]